MRRRRYRARRERLQRLYILSPAERLKSRSESGRDCLTCAEFARQRVYLTIHSSVLESQLPHKIVNFWLTTTNKIFNSRLCEGVDFVKLINRYILSDKDLGVRDALGEEVDAEEGRLVRRRPEHVQELHGVGVQELFLGVVGCGIFSITLEPRVEWCNHL